MFKNEQKRLKIAMLGHKRIPSREGGVEIVVEELSTRMVKREQEVTCFNRKGNHVSGKEYGISLAHNKTQDNVYKGVSLKSVATIDKKGLAAMTASVSAAFKAAFGNYDIVHFHAEGPCAMLWLPHLLGKRCIATIHGLDWNREKWKGGFGSKYIKFGERIAAKYADEIIVLSKGVYKYFKETYGRDTKYIPNGVTRPHFREATCITLKYGLHKKDYILFLGRIVPEKGIRYLVEAFKMVKTHKRLVIAGGSSDTDDFMEELKSLAAGDSRIIFTGFVQGQPLEELYSNAYIYTLPSDLEGMPLSLLEAMSYGNCCLVSDIAECADVVEDKAVLFQRGNINDLRDKLQMLCDSPDIVNFYSAQASDFICQKYSWDEVVDKTLVLYRNCKLIGRSENDLITLASRDKQLNVNDVARQK